MVVIELGCLIFLAYLTSRMVTCDKDAADVVSNSIT
jgi:hypothetical protein